MKKIILILLATVLFSCEKNDISFNDDFKKSKKAWNSYKNSINNSYSYVIHFSSVFDFYSETKIIVKNGKVIGRAFEAGGTNYEKTPPQSEITESWTEDITNLNTHTTGSEPLTLDEIYEKASREWLNADTKKNNVYFTTDKNSLIESCGYVSKNCMDDCFIGVHIKDITEL